MRSATALLLALAATTTLAACGEDIVTSTSTSTSNAPAATSGSATSAKTCSTHPALKAGVDDFCNQVTLTTESDGLQEGDFVVGTGAQAKSGSSVTVQYTGWLTDGTSFDSSRQSGRQPFQFTLGQGSVIKGWDEGVVGMKVGGKRRLEIPGSLAYGPSGQGSTIPPNATLVFDIELLSVS